MDLGAENEQEAIVQSPLVKKRMLEKLRETVPMKLDAIFAPMRSDSVDDMRTSIKVKGVGDINLKPQTTSKSAYDRNKMDEEIELKRAMRKQIQMPDKPAKFKKPVKVQPKEPTPPPKEESPRPTELAPAQKEPTPPLIKFDSPEKELTPPPSEEKIPINPIDVEIPDRYFV